MKIFQRVFVAQRSWKFLNAPKIRNFFLIIFLKLPNFIFTYLLSNFHFWVFFKGQKRPRWRQNPKITNVAIVQNAPYYRYRGYIHGGFFVQKAFLKLVTSKKYFWGLSTLKFRKKKIFWLQKSDVRRVF